jgi:hypothetical protein
VTKIIQIAFRGDIMFGLSEGGIVYRESIVDGEHKWVKWL